MGIAFTAVHNAYMDDVVTRLARTKWNRTRIRQWRDYRELTLEELGAQAGWSHASISRVERGLQPYSQELLEALAKALGTDPASLLIRNPYDPEGIWSIWNRASQSQRRQIVEMAKILLKTGS